MNADAHSTSTIDHRREHPPVDRCTTRRDLRWERRVGDRGRCAHASSLTRDAFSTSERSFRSHSVSLYDRDMVDPQRLRVFRAVVQTGSINRLPHVSATRRRPSSQHVAASARDRARRSSRRAAAASCRPPPASPSPTARPDVLDQLPTSRRSPTTCARPQRNAAHRMLLSAEPRVDARGRRHDSPPSSPTCGSSSASSSCTGSSPATRPRALHRRGGPRRSRSAVADGAADGYELEPLRAEGYVAVVIALTLEIATRRSSPPRPVSGSPPPPTPTWSSSAPSNSRAASNPGGRSACWACGRRCPCPTRPARGTRRRAAAGSPAECPIRATTCDNGRWWRWGELNPRPSL